MKTITPKIRRAAPAPESTPSAAAPLHVEIETVVLHGFSRSDGQRAAAAFERELARVVMTQGIPEVRSTAHLNAGDVPAGARPEITGARAARAIHGGLGA
jgi:hypothetical protein